MPRTVVVATGSGKLRGAAGEGVLVFRGIPYAASTAGGNRFQPPKPVAWTGVRDALQYGPRSPQGVSAAGQPYFDWLNDATPTGEDCLVLNVFAPSTDDGAKRPVMVYLHGGGFTVGSAGANGLDGGNLARRGVVLVSVNHRLNVFGHLYLGDADGGRFADAGNAGMLDLVAALRWVKDNIAQFGGDPGNVTIFGQSGGGSKVGALMAMAQARGLFHKAIIQSASSLFTMASLEEAERNTHFFLAELGLARSGVRKLLELPSGTLLKVMASAIASAGGVDNYRPAVDGRSLGCQPFDAAAAHLSADIPLMTGWCETEQRLNFAGTPQVFGQSMAQAIEATASVVGISRDRAARLIEAYRVNRPDDSPGDLFAQICGDHRYRRTVTRAAELRLRQAGAPVYLYLVRWRTAVHDGLLRTPHTMCLAFAFANVERAVGITGTDPDRYRLQEEMAGAWIAFAHTGNPNHDGLPPWLPYTARKRPTMVFDRRSQCMADPLRVERVALQSCPRYVAARAQGFLRNGGAV